MNKDVLLGILRHVLTTTGGSLVASGTLSSSDLEIGVGSLVTLLGVIWSVVKNRSASK